MKFRLIKGKMYLTHKGMKRIEFIDNGPWPARLCKNALTKLERAYLKEYLKKGKLYRALKGS